MPDSTFRAQCEACTESFVASIEQAGGIGSTEGAVARGGDQPSKTYYTAQRQRGHTHGRALRAVADRLRRILVAMLTTRTLFDCSKARPPQVNNLPEKVA